jgi:RHS repeat-associated protein
MTNVAPTRAASPRSRIKYCQEHASARLRPPVPADPHRDWRFCTSEPVGYDPTTTTASEGSIHRYYDPTTGQFLSVDPAVSITGQPYSYAGDDPVNQADPTGLCNQPGTSQFLVPGPCEFSNINWVHQAEDYLQAQVTLSSGPSFGDFLESQADFWAGAANSVVSGVTFGNVHISAPFCSYADEYTAGGIYGLVAPFALGVGEVEAPAAADEFDLGVEGVSQEPEPAWGPGTPAAGQPPDESTVAEILKGKLGSIQRAPLPPGSPSWSDISSMTLSQIREGAQDNLPGYRTILKLLTNRDYNKP